MDSKSYVSFLGISIWPFKIGLKLFSFHISIFLLLRSQDENWKSDLPGSLLTSLIKVGYCFGFASTRSWKLKQILQNLLEIWNWSKITLLISNRVGEFQISRQTNEPIKLLALWTCARVNFRKNQIICKFNYRQTGGFQ